ncbi:MAG TPA: ribonuclease Z [Prolixibacteraceae bacterium]|jgi:ribonuclease Z
MLPFSVTILGSSSALPTITRFPTSQVVNLSDHLYLIDCGEGAQIQLQKFGIKTGKINHIFISHLHGDHIFGLPGLISSLALGGKKGELHIYSHSELKIMLDHLMKFMNEFTDLKVVYHPLSFRGRAVIFEDSKMIVESFPLKHRIPCCGFIFREKTHELHLRGDLINYLKVPIKDRVAIKAGANFQTPEGRIIPNADLTFPPDPVRSYAFCTDTVCRKQIIPIIENVDLLYHEATFADELSDLALKTYHTTAKQAAQLAIQANVKKLIIGHFSSRYKSVKPLVDEAREVFPNTYPANDGDIFEL